MPRQWTVINQISPLVTYPKQSDSRSSFCITNKVTEHHPDIIQSSDLLPELQGWLTKFFPLKLISTPSLNEYLLFQALCWVLETVLFSIF